VLQRTDCGAVDGHYAGMNLAKHHCAAYVAWRVAVASFFCAAGGLLGTTMNAQAQTPVAVPPVLEISAWADQFEAQVDHRLQVPVAQQLIYVALLEQTLAQSQTENTMAQTFIVVDRNPNVQAAFVLVHLQSGVWQWIGATAVSTGKVGSYEHFVTPLGVFAHTLDNPDFRAEGTFNKNHIRGYGLKGLRVFDFGWQYAERGWGVGGSSRMRLQMHATDPSILEERLGSVQSEGCIRIPSSLNVFLDMHGVLDAAYEAATSKGDDLWVLKPGRTVVPWPGRYMVIVDSQVLTRPDWSPTPAVLQKASAARALANRQVPRTRLQPALTKPIVRTAL
jgi:hypothetical protein